MTASDIRFPALILDQVSCGSLKGLLSVHVSALSTGGLGWVAVGITNGRGNMLHPHILGQHDLDGTGSPGASR